MLDPDSPCPQGMLEPTQDPDIFSLVDLRLIEAENGTHYHWDPATQFYNQCHDEDGKFCEGDSGTKEPISGRAWYDYKENEPLSDWHLFPGLDTTEDAKRGDEGFTQALKHTEEALDRREEDASYDLYDSVTRYTYKGDRLINDRLRKSTPNEQADKDIKSLDTLFQKDSYPTQGINLYRGAKQRPEVSYAPGSIISDPGFVSTTGHPNTAKSFVWQEAKKTGNGVLFKIKTKDDTPSLVGSHSETEFILNRGTALKVNTVASDLASRNLIVEAEVL